VRPLRLRLAQSLVAVAVLLAIPMAAQAAAIDVTGAKLRVSIGPPASGGAGNSAQVQPLQGGGAIVSLHGSVSPADMTVGAGCQQVATGNAASIPFDFPAGGGGSPRFAATCDMTGVRVVEGRLLNSNFGAQGWFSTIDLPTSVTAQSNSGNAAGQGGNKIVTGSAGDRITGSNDSDTIDAGSAPYKGQETLPPSGTAALDDPNRNFVDGGGGDDTLLLRRGTGRDIVTGGTGTDLATYAGRFAIGPPGSTGVNVTLDGQANDGDPAIDQPDATSPTEGDNVGVDVENLTGTSRADQLIGNGLQNVLVGDEGVDTLTGGNGEDTVIAREPASAGSGTPDVISCGAPTPLRSATTAFGVLSTSSGSDRLQADLADPKPGDCELLVDMAVAEPAPINIANTARSVRGKRLRVQLTCPRAAKRTCRGRLQLAGKRAGSNAAKFSIKGGAKRTVTLRLSAKAAAAVARRRAVARLVSNEKGLKGEVNRVALVRLR
jgi:hypothetical protein